MDFIGLCVRVVGTVVTIVGFVIAVQQLRKTRSAAEAGNKAISELKAKLTTYSAVSEIARAMAALKETDRHLKHGGWADAVDSYTEVRQAMNRLAELPSSIDEPKREQLRDAIEQVAELCKKLDVATLSQKKPGGIAGAIHLNRQHGDFLARISIHIEQGAS
ncbi:hypothetical protein [Phenylobacterium sp.]|uniref:hypothetical protein n=1 Tax=Phenylobacterium sp. TaxID=1871053 RepID=UPI0030F46864